MENRVNRHLELKNDEIEKLSKRVKYVNEMFSSVNNSVKSIEI